ncbi:MAG: type II secretion system F family protein [Acidimicrobiales bacterium]
MTALAVTLVGAYGVFLIYTSVACRWSGFGVGPATSPSAGHRDKTAQWLAQAGLQDVAVRQFGAVMAALFVLGLAVAYTVFGGLLPGLVAGAFAASFPVGSARARRQRRRHAGRDAWPSMIEEIRLQTGSLGRSVPQALFDVGRRTPAELRPAFAAAEREWLLSTDFPRTVASLKVRLADATADATLETLLVAYEVGGSDLDRRLAALAEDRIADLQGRKDAQAKQAGVRFARRFVLIVPVGMALAGLSIGTGRRAYQTVAGQLAVAAGLGFIAACWAWAGLLMKLPEEERVFHTDEAAARALGGGRGPGR